MTSASPSPVALITGAGRGIGRAAAVELASRGYRLALASRTPSQLEQTVAALPAGAEALAVPADVAAPTACRGLVARALDRLGRLDAVVHCAGLAPAVPAAEMPDEQWDAVLAVNLSAAFHLAKAAWPGMKQGGGGALVFLSSFSSRDPFPGFAAYGAAKAGLNVLAKVLAREGAPHRIRVHTIAPGAVETEMFRGLVTPEQWPASKTLAPADVARIIAACVTGDLAATSGEVIHLSREPA